MEEWRLLLCKAIDTQMCKDEVNHVQNIYKLCIH